MRIIVYILLIIIAVVGVTFASLNAETVTFNYYVGIKHLPLSLLLILSFAVGSLFGLFFGLLIYAKTKRQALHYKKRAKLAEKEVANIRAMPITDKH